MCNFSYGCGLDSKRSTLYHGERLWKEKITKHGVHDSKVEIDVVLKLYRAQTKIVLV